MGVPSPGGVSGPGGVCSGRCLLQGGVVSQHALRQTPLPVNRMTDRCKNITLATTSLRLVINNLTYEVRYFLSCKQI